MIEWSSILLTFNFISPFHHSNCILVHASAVYYSVGEPEQALRLGWLWEGVRVWIPVEDLSRCRFVISL